MIAGVSECSVARSVFRVSWSVAKDVSSCVGRRRSGIHAFICAQADVASLRAFCKLGASRSLRHTTSLHSLTQDNAYRWRRLGGCSGCSDSRPQRATRCSRGRPDPGLWRWRCGAEVGGWELTSSTSGPRTTPSGPVRVELLLVSPAGFCSPKAAWAMSWRRWPSCRAVQCPRGRYRPSRLQRGASPARSPAAAWSRRWCGWMMARLTGEYTFHGVVWS